MDDLITELPEHGVRHVLARTSKTSTVRARQTSWENAMVGRQNALMASNEPARSPVDILVMTRSIVTPLREANMVIADLMCYFVSSASRTGRVGNFPCGSV
jgi:hypothetical protein